MNRLVRRIAARLVPLLDRWDRLGAELGVVLAGVTAARGAVALARQAAADVRRAAGTVTPAA